MPPPIRKTSEGLLITSGTLSFLVVVCSLLGALATGVIGAIRYMNTLVPTRSEYSKHLVTDSLIHHDQWVHAAFVDSVLARAVRDNHGTACYLLKYPVLMCSDLSSGERRP